MYFAEFLLAKNIVTEVQLRQACCNHKNKISNLIGTTKLSTGCDPGRCLTEAINCDEAYKKEGPAIGLVLLEQNYIKKIEFKNLISEYYGFSNAMSLAGTVFTIEAISQIEETAVPTFNYAKLEYDMAQEYGQQMDDIRRNELEHCVLSFNQVLDPEQLKWLYREFHTIKGTAKFLGAPVTEYIVHQLEDLLSLMTRNADKVEQPLRVKCEDLFLIGLDIIWDLRCMIYDQQSEKDFLIEKGTVETPSANYQKFKRALAEVQKLSAEVLKLEEEIDLDAFKDRF